MSIAVNVAGAWKEGTPEKVNVGGVWKTVSAAKVNVGGVWKDVFPTDAPPPGVSGLYDVNIVHKGARVVDFTALTTITHAEGEEAYMFRCAEASSLNGYVAKNFTKTFPQTAYTKYNCTLQDMSGDILATDAKTISFTVDNK